MKHLHTSGADHLTFKGVGGGVWLISEKISCRLISGKKTPGAKKPYTDFEQEKNPTKIISCQCIEICLATYVQFVIQNIRQTWIQPFYAMCGVLYVVTEIHSQVKSEYCFCLSETAGFVCRRFIQKVLTLITNISASLT